MDRGSRVCGLCTELTRTETDTVFLLNFSKCNFQSSEHHTQTSVHLHWTEVEAEVSETDSSQPGTIKRKPFTWLDTTGGKLHLFSTITVALSFQSYLINWFWNSEIGTLDFLNFKIKYLKSFHFQGWINLLWDPGGKNELPGPKKPPVPPPLFSFGTIFYITWPQAQ